MSVQIGTSRLSPPKRASTLDIAIGVLAARPEASLAEIASAAGIGRTTLHKQHATRQDLLIAVAHEALSQLGQAVAATDEIDDIADALERLVLELVPIGAGLAFIARQPSLDDNPDVAAGVHALENRLTAVVRRGQEAGVLRTDLPDWWFVYTLEAQIYVAWEAVELGRLAPLMAPDMVLSTLVEGLGRK